MPTGRKKGTKKKVKPTAKKYAYMFPIPERKAGRTGNRKKKAAV